MIEFSYMPSGFPRPSSSRPLVTHFLKVYNQAQYIREVLGSVLAQDYAPLEIVISDNCSTDGSRELILAMLREYQLKSGSHSVIYNRNADNIGVARNAEMCLKLAHGVICVQNDGDDVSVPNRVQRIVEAFLSFENVTLVDSTYHTVSLSGERHMASKWSGKFMFLKSDPNIIAHSIPRFRGAVLAYRRSAVLAYADMPVDAWADDIILSYRACLKGNVVHIDEPLIYYRTGAGISTGRTKTIEKSIKVNRGRMRCYEQLVQDIRSLHRNDLDEAERVMRERVESCRLFLDALGGDGVMRRVASATQLLAHGGALKRNVAALVLSLCPKRLRERLYKLWGKA